MLTASISKLVPFTHNPTNVLAVHTSVLNALDYGTHIVLIVDLFVSHAVPSTSTVPEKIVPLLRTSNFRTFETSRLPLPREIRDFGKIASPLHLHLHPAPAVHSQKAPESVKRVKSIAQILVKNKMEVERLSQC